VNHAPPCPEIVAPGLAISSDELAVIGVLARTYEPQRLRIVQRAAARELAGAGPPPRPVNMLDPGVRLDGRALSASIVDVVTTARRLAGTPIRIPFLDGSGEVLTAEAGWWDALLGDVERRVGLTPRSFKVLLPLEIPAAVCAIFADRLPS
jgi:hypothetical protein